MRRLIGLAVLASILLAGCGGGGGGGGENTIDNAQFRIAWPARSRAALAVGLSSAQSATVVFSQAGPGGANVTMNVSRDPARAEAHTATYTIPTSVSPSRLNGVTATFYAQPSQGGAVVGTATTTASIAGGNIEFATITFAGRITQVAAVPTTLSITDQATQLLFTTRDANNDVVAVTPGSASWSLVSGNAITLTPDGVATPVAAGTAQVSVTVDAISSVNATITVEAPSTTVFTWNGPKGGTLINPSFDAVEGNRIRVTGGKNVVVTALGYEASRPTSPGGEVGLFNTDGSLIVAATVSNADTLMDGYYYKQITPVTLVAGQEYYIGALHGTGAAGAYQHQTNAAATPPFIQELGSTFKVTSTLTGGTWEGLGGPGHYVANLRAYQVP